MLFKKVSIIGVGLIGGSIGMAIRRKNIAGTVVGIGRRKSSITTAKKLGAIDEATLDIKSGVRGSDLIIVSAPTDLVISKIKEAVKHLEDLAIIIDVASVKEKIVKNADAITGKRKNISFVGTHPMAGAEESGVSMARPDLFKDCICIITPTRNTNIVALNKIKKFWQAIGTKIRIMPADKHDFAVAKISHLPHLLAYSLCSACTADEIGLAGPGFKDSTRIAKSNPKMWAEIFMQNKTNLIKSKNIFDKKLKSMQSYIAKNNKGSLVKELNLSKRKRDSIG